MSELISVVMPVFNAEMFIREAVESVLAQSYRDLELIVVDDGSTDRGLHIVENCSARDERVRMIYMELGGVFQAQRRP